MKLDSSWWVVTYIVTNFGLSVTHFVLFIEGSILALERFPLFFFGVLIELSIYVCDCKIKTSNLKAGFYFVLLLRWC